MDQIFSCISRWLKLKQALTVPALAAEIVKSYSNRQGRPNISYLEDSADVKSWLQPFVSAVNNITSSHQYFFERKMVNGVCKAVMSCKMYAACKDESIETVGCLLKVNLYFFCWFAF